MGKAVFQLLALQGKDTLANEPVPFEVSPLAPVKVMIMASFPDFEYKFLKNWLYDNHYPLIFRAQISKEKYSTDFLNMASLPMRGLNRQLLKEVDFLIIDEEMLKAISGAERAAIDQEIVAGLGMLIRKDSAKVNQAPLETRMQGRGRVLNSTAAATYSWLLDGAHARYAEYWTDLITQGARKKNTPFNLALQPQFSVVGQRTRLLIEQSTVVDRPQVEVNENKLAVRQNMAIPFQWDAVLWPDTAGWMAVKVGKAIQSFYVYHPEDWQGLRKNNTRIANQEFFADRLQQKAAVPDMVRAHKTISLWWFYALFLISVGYLWFESRFLRNKLN